MEYQEILARRKEILARPVRPIVQPDDDVTQRQPGLCRGRGGRAGRCNYAQQRAQGPARQKRRSGCDDEPAVAHCQQS